MELSLKTQRYYYNNQRDEWQSVGIKGALVPDWFWYTVMSIITGSIIVEEIRRWRNKKRSSQSVYELKH